jgi:polyribonucleotide nucleotidyltransferase
LNFDLKHSIQTSSYFVAFKLIQGNFKSVKVDYQEKQYAQGVIPTTYMRREGAPKERELLCGRLIDRPIRPLFPPGFYHEVQVFFFNTYMCSICPNIFIFV